MVDGFISPPAKTKKKKTNIGSEPQDLERRVEQILNEKGIMLGFNQNPYMQPPPMMYPPPYPPQMMNPNYMPQNLGESAEEDYVPKKSGK